MFERYTEKARRVIFFARYEAAQFGAPAIEPEHILLGIVREDRVRTQRLLSKSVTVESVRREVEGRTLIRERISSSVEIPLAPQSKRILAYAHEESDRMEHRHIGVDHLLLGVLREDGSLAAEILYEQGFRLSVVRDLVRQDYQRNALDAIRLAFRDQNSELDLSKMGLTVLPQELEVLTWLRRLNLSHNRLHALPEFVGHLSHLEYLDLSHNELTVLPDSLLSLTNLDTLYLHENEALNLPTEILGPPPSGETQAECNPTKILEYYYRIRSSDERRSLNEAKLILVGRGAVGKTSIVNRLVYNVFRDEKRTEGIQITKWNIRLGGRELVRLNVWDFGGQEILHATHQFFLTSRSLYVLVLTGREGVEDGDADYWLKLIESFGDQSPVIVVLNKIEEYPFDVNRRALQKKYPNIHHFVSTDCKVGTGLEELRAAIKTEADRLEHLRTAFPENWFAIKETLAVMRTNYLSFDEYRDECSRLGENDPSAQDALSSYLHNLGIALNYKDDPRLQDTYVLNPHWVTNGIYTVLSSNKLRESGGETQLWQFSEILDGENYPVRMHRFLFDLMKKFELCFSFPDDDYSFLIPELLDKQEPAEASRFRPNECLNFQYHYSVLPEGLVPRFIVRTNVLSEGLPRWRSGVILKFEDNHALVKADMQDRKIFIAVAGPPSGRRRLLAIIRSDFEHIHRSIRSLLPQEMVALPDFPTEVVAYSKLLAMEAAGLENFPDVVDGKVVHLNVGQLLNGVDLEGARLREILINEPLSSVQLFYCYSRKDEGLRDELDTHLKLMQRQGLITTWHDRNIDAGEDWKQRIDENLERADIILLLVSADFIASEYCFAKEMKRALERHETRSAQVIPIIVRDVSLSAAPFGGIQFLPRDGRAIMLWENRDSAWRNVSEGIKRVAEGILQEKANRHS